MSNVRLLSCSDGIYRYRLNGREESLPLRPNHYWGGEVGGGISSLSLPEVTGRGRRRITYVFKGATWVGLYRREADGEFHLSASYGIPTPVDHDERHRADVEETLRQEREIREDERRHGW